MKLVLDSGRRRSGPVINPLGPGTSNVDLLSTGTRPRSQSSAALLTATMAEGRATSHLSYTSEQIRTCGHPSNTNSWDTLHTTADQMRQMSLRAPFQRERHPSPPPGSHVGPWPPQTGHACAHQFLLSHLTDFNGSGAGASPVQHRRAQSGMACLLQCVVCRYDRVRASVQENLYTMATN